MSGRLPFDPDRMKPPKPARGRSDPDRPLSVSELAARVDSAIKTGLPARVRVLGEISGLRERTHFYFAIKDSGAAISAVFFASTARRLATPPQDGLQVIATGRVEFYAPSGKLSLIIDRLEPVGKGPLEQRFQQLATELKEKGWFDPENKSALPSFPERIAVITSATSAALQDVIDTARRRCLAVGLLVVDVRVQGDSAVGEITHALHALSRSHERLGIEAILLTRGGGSLEDLWAFNEREVAQAIWDCPIPVVAAIGHETDTTIAELVADERGATPTQAAMRLTPDHHAIREQTDAIDRRLKDSTRGRLRFARERLRRFAEHPVFQSPAELLRPHADRIERIGRTIHSIHETRMLSRRSHIDRLSLRLERIKPSTLHARREERLEALSDRLGRLIRRRIAPDRVDLLERNLRAGVLNRIAGTGIDLDAIERELEAVSPARVLQRGYSVSIGPDGRVIVDPKRLSAGDRVRTLVSEGVFDSKVIESESAPQGTPPAPRTPPAPQSPAPKKPSPKRRKHSDARDQMDLFASGG